MLWWQWGMLYQASSNCVIELISLFNKSTTVILSSILFHCFSFHFFLFLDLIDTGLFLLLCLIVTWNVIIWNLFATYFKCVVFFLPPARFWKRWEVLFWGPSPSPPSLPYPPSPLSSRMFCSISRLLLKLAFWNLACAIYAKKYC